MELPKRKSPRIPGYDYSTPNYYFITICTHDKRCNFGGPEKLGPYGRIAWEYLWEIPRHFPGIKVDNAVIMPNHVHAIIVVTAETEEHSRRDLTIAIGQYKMAVTRIIRAKEQGKKVWQRSFHDHVIRNQKAYEKIWTYIHYNPQLWHKDGLYVIEEECKQ